jgi:integrase
VLFVRQTLSHDGKEFIPGAKTSSGIRSIALDQDTLNILKRHLELVSKDKDNKDYKDGGLVDSNLPRITFHDLRYTHASLLLKNNVHPKVVSERLGHSSIQITLDSTPIYCRICKKRR